MKKLFILFVLTFFVVCLEAQPVKGALLVGTTTDLTGASLSLISSTPNSGGIAFTKMYFKSDDYESDKYKVTILNLTPQIGVFISDGLLVGGQVSLQYLKEKEDENPTTSFAVGPFVRYYVPANGGFRPFLQASFNVGQISYDQDGKTNLTEYGGGIGGAIFLGPKTSFDLFIGYNHIVSKDPDSADNWKEIIDTFGFGVGLSVFL
jgi:hypothetical protein